MLPVFEGDEAQVRQDHEANLAECDAVLIYYGAANELWLRSKLRELQKIAGYGRSKPIVIKAVYIAPPDNTGKAAVPHPRCDGHQLGGAPFAGLARAFVSRLKPAQKP